MNIKSKINAQQFRDVILENDSAALEILKRDKCFRLLMIDPKNGNIVAYPDDGTMVIMGNVRTSINEAIDRFDDERCDEEMKKAAEDFVHLFEKYIKSLRRAIRRNQNQTSS